MLAGTPPDHVEDSAIFMLLCHPLRGKRSDPMQKEELFGQTIFVIHAFLTPEECAALIADSEAMGYGDAPITMGGSAIILKDVRNNTRVMVDDPERAAILFERGQPFLPDLRGRWKLAGLNERFRYYRYEVSQTFTQHYDGSFRRSDREESKLTFMVYLNDDFEGGTTDFFHEDGKFWLRVEPKAGMALVFAHPLLHEGTSVQSGRKYVLRTDVMYTLPSSDAEARPLSWEEWEKATDG